MPVTRFRGRPRRHLAAIKPMSQMLHEQRNKRFIEAAKATPCMDCKGSFPPCCMEFDHRDPSQKKFQVSTGLCRSLEAVRREIAKCDVVCANCHRIRSLKHSKTSIIS